MSRNYLETSVRLFAGIPLPLVRLIARGLAAILFWLPNREAHTADVNLGLCFPGLDKAERRRLLRSALSANVTTLLEMPAAWVRPSEWWVVRIELDDTRDAIAALLAEGKGVIVAAPHLGNWEVGVHALGSMGLAPFTVLYRPPRKKELEPILVSGRGHAGVNLVPTDRKGIRALYQALERGEIVTILPDQQPKRSAAGAVYAPFFGVPALTMTLVNRLAAKSDAPVYFVFCERGQSGKYRMRGLRASAAIANRDPVVAATELNACVERCVIMNPAQYLWSYRRFDAQPHGAASPYKQKKPG